MPLFKWGPEYCINVEQIDSQHEQLVEWNNELANVNTGENNDAIIGKVLKNLVEYMQTHFSVEEKLMREIGFPELTQHITLHKKLATEVTAILIRLKKGKKPKIEEVKSLLHRWLNDHILIEDLKIRHLIEQPIKSDVSRLPE